MEAIYEIQVHWIGLTIRGRVWRFFYSAKRRAARVINLWVYRVHHINQQGMILRPACNEREGLDLIHSDRIYQTDAEKRENKRTARRFFEVEFGWEG